MSISTPFITRPVATLLLTLGIVMAGALAYRSLPVAPLPQIDMPAIMVQANLPGANPQTVATSVTEPLERHLGAIADVTEMTSESANGSSRIVLLFGLDRDINGAARDVEAAINAARVDLPAALHSNPTYRKLNTADFPVLVLALRSNTLTRAALYDAATNILQQRLSQIEGVGQVQLGGGAAPAVRVELNPQALFNYGIGLEDVRAAIAGANAHSPKGIIENRGDVFQIDTNDQAIRAADYRPLVIAYRHNAAVRLSDVATVIDGIEDVHNLGLSQGKDAVVLFFYREPGANIIDVVKHIKAALPPLMAAMPKDVDWSIASDRSTSIAASLLDTQITLILAVLLVIGVVFIFLRNVRAILIPAIAVPVSIIGTFALMYLCGFSLDNMSLMALTISTGFVVDDTIVVLENVERHIEAGLTPFKAAIKGAGEVGFTVVSISLSLIAVFIPILLMTGIMGRLFREFAITLSLAILISMMVALTTTPMLCARLLRPKTEIVPNLWLDHIRDSYVGSLDWALRHGGLLMLILAATLALNVYLFGAIPKTFFPEVDIPRLMGQVVADQTISFQNMSAKLHQIDKLVRADPAVETTVIALGGGGGMRAALNSAMMILTLKPQSQSHLTANQVAMRLHRKLAVVPGVNVYLQVPQDLRMGGRPGNATYQYTLQGDSTDEVYAWTPRLVAALQADHRFTDVSSDLQTSGLETELTIDRDRAAQFGVNVADIDNTLSDAFGQRQVSTIYKAQTEYRVVMELDPKYQTSPTMLDHMWVSTAGTASGTQSTNLITNISVGAGNAGANAARNAATNAIAAKGGTSAGSAVSTTAETMVPFSDFISYARGLTPLAVEHSGPFVSTTISFNLAPGASLSQAQAGIDQAESRIMMPNSVTGSFSGAAALFKDFASDEVLLIVAALTAVYVVLGILYESFMHPLTIISTLPSAGVGALLALILFNIPFSLIAMIGVLLLVGIVKKNAILMIDFALNAERVEGLSTHEAILKACKMRFRPIMMTTASAMFGAVPLAIAFGTGSELRQPLGISIVGGLLISQALTLYTTPIIYLYLDRFRNRLVAAWQRPKAEPAE